jgi:hypothetical protein
MTTSDMRKVLHRLDVIETAIERKNRNRRGLRRQLGIERDKRFYEAFIFRSERQWELAIIKLQRDILWLRNRRYKIVEELKNKL